MHMICIFTAYMYVPTIYIHPDYIIESQSLYTPRQIPAINCFSSRLAAVSAHSIEAKCQVENEDIVRASPTGDAQTTIVLSTKVCLY